MANANTTRIRNATAATLVASRSRIGHLENGWLIRRLSAENIARSANRVQQAPLAAGLELATQVRDEDLDRVGRGEGVIAPDLVEQPLARDHDPFVAHQVLEQLELALRQLDVALAAMHLVGIGVEAEVAGDPHLVALEPQRALKNVGDVAVVFNDKHAW